METAISTFCKTLDSFCNHVDTSTHDLSDSIRRRPIPLDSAASAFLNSLDRRISTASADLNLLDSMTRGTVSVAELLGHCNEVYNTNRKYISQIQDRMISFGYVPGIELDDEVGEDPGLESEFLSPTVALKELDLACGSVSVARSRRKEIQEDLLFEDSLSLQNLGLSDTCLATLASEDQDYPASPTLPSQNVISHDDWQPQKTTAPFQPPIDAGGATKTNTIKTSKDEYDSLPSYMKSLASWEELQKAVSKLNDYISKREIAKESSAIDQHDLGALGLDHKGRSYLLILLRMKQLVVETVDGAIQYRACVH